ncbi:hypothetical protein [Helicobacter cetorum]|uniref:Uncharacterized protein n=1 Tax=Helicobacter cetorum (strain ATCC BAA-540 / CCUG 52418 / MIT 99-5656) TaxID=1163745 RepID=I0ERT2_HELCM|nr:hypothetical protein [Helicobacter cetorum]AFI05651.1 hypothetical protein HCD_03175 [Helicobacter cetorum MIT 99-5656]
MDFLKVLKHDALEQIGNIVVTNLLLTLIILAICFFSQSTEETTMLTLSYTLFFILGAFLLSAIILGAIKNLNAKLFSKRGVLSFSLPISIDMLLLPKVLLPIGFFILSLLWFILSVRLGYHLFTNTQSSVLFILYSALKVFVLNPTKMVGIMLFLGLVLMKFLFVLSVLNTNKIKKARFLLGGLLFILVGVILEMAFNAFLPLMSSNLSMNEGFYYFLQQQELEEEKYYLLWGVDFLKILLLYGVSRYLLTHKLELD